MVLVDAGVDVPDLDSGTIGAAAIVASDVPLSCTATAFSEISYWLVIFALGALACNHCLKLLRSAASCARYDFTAVLLKLIFFPIAGFVPGYVLTGAPVS